MVLIVGQSVSLPSSGTRRRGTSPPSIRGSAGSPDEHAVDAQHAWRERCYLTKDSQALDTPMI